MERNSVNALILAGTRQGEQDFLAKLNHVSHKAIIPILGKPMIDYVVQALSKVSNIENIIVSIEETESVKEMLPDYVKYLPSAYGPSSSIINGIQELSTPLLITTADNPLLKAQWIEYFLREAELHQCDIAVGIALKSQIENDVMGTNRTYIKLADGSFSGCNLFLFRTPQSIRVAQLWQTLERHRKYPAKMGLLLGYEVVLRYFLRCLTRKTLKKRIFRLTQAKIHFIVMPWGQAAVDVDKIDDLVLVNSLIQS
ncbi:hypothetical protein COMNV_00241 [Commensalibacter sp. Nvir]|uniref:nucleotidyltransferase family protein n=1 Tax=Commensalibacter sp. Nvir TaxID=3069817 RepID=UPI002D49175F|nr:hypothetical protein COMNV_00241 [Commensalibacter sp. Nvir]